MEKLKTKCQLIERFFNALSTNEQVPELLQRLKVGETSFHIVKWLDEAAMRKPNTSVDQMAENSLSFDAEGAYCPMQICSVLNRS